MWHRSSHSTPRHQHIVEIGLTLLNQVSMHSKYWVKAFQTVVFLINCIPTPILKTNLTFKSFLTTHQITNFFALLALHISEIFVHLIITKWTYDQSNVFLWAIISIIRAINAIIYPQAASVFQEMFSFMKLNSPLFIYLA